MKWSVLGLIAMLALIASVVLGPAAVPLSELLRSDIVWNLRAPRALLAFLVGGALGVAGAGLQALVRNPLADPFLLGLSGGAGLGAVLAIALHLSGPWALPVAAFAGALVALALVYRLGLIGGAAPDPRLLLLGGRAVRAFEAATGRLLVLPNNLNNLVELDPADGHEIRRSSLPVSVQSWAGMAIDPASGQVWVGSYYEGPQITQIHVSEYSVHKMCAIYVICGFLDSSASPLERNPNIRSTTAVR